MRILQEYSDELEADLMEFFQVDLLDFWRGRLSLRKINVYITSLLKKHGRSTLLMALDETSEWGPEGYILARISDALELSNYFFIQANTTEEQKGKEAIPLPTPFPRPGDPLPEEEESSKHEFATGHEVADFFNQMSNP